MPMHVVFDLLWGINIITEWVIGVKMGITEFCECHGAIRVVNPPAIL